MFEAGSNGHLLLFVTLSFCCRTLPAVTQQLADPLEYRVIALEAGHYCDDRPWRLVFEDEFLGDSLNTDVWLRFFPYCLNQDECQASRVHGWPGELQLFFDENVSLSGDGVLRMEARRGTLRHWYSAASVYSAGMIHSRSQFGKGRYECRARVPKSTANYLWPSFWLFGGGPHCSEIDALEVLWRASDTYHAALHRYNSVCDGSVADDNYGIELGELSDDFHVYRVDWATWFVDFYVDEQLIYRACRIYDLLARPVPQCEIKAGIYMQNQAFPAQDAQVSVIAGLGLHKSPWVQASGAGIIIPDLPATMEIDYIRVYQRE